MASIHNRDRGATLFYGASRATGVSVALKAQFVIDGELRASVFVPFDGGEGRVDNPVPFPLYLAAGLRPHHHPARP